MSVPKEYHLTCSTMSCVACEKAIEKCLMEIPKVEKVKADSKLNSIIVTTSSCNSCEECVCCKCSPCTCDPCRCCSCGVDAYIRALESIGYAATYPASDTAGDTQAGTTYISSMMEQWPNSFLMSAFVVVFAAGFLAAKVSSGSPKF